VEKVTEIKLSEFKMCEPAPYEQPDPRTLIPLIIQTEKAVEKTYGPVFTIRFIKYTLQCVAQKTGNEPPYDIKTLDELGTYLITLSDKYPTCYSLMTYAGAKTENDLQGQVGAGTRFVMIDVSRNIAKGSNLTRERNVDLDDLVSKFRQAIVAPKLSPREMGYRKNEDGSVDILWPDCNFKEGCKLAFDAGLSKRPDGRQSCASGAFLIQFFKLATGYEWDYDVLESYKPYCIHRCYMF
jgi:hypothetical protein